MYFRVSEVGYGFYKDEVKDVYCILKSEGSQRVDGSKMIRCVFPYSAPCYHIEITIDSWDVEMGLSPKDEHLMLCIDALKREEDAPLVADVLKRIGRYLEGIGTPGDYVDVLYNLADILTSFSFSSPEEFKCILNEVYDCSFLNKVIFPAAVDIRAKSNYDVEVITVRMIRWSGYMPKVYEKSRRERGREGFLNTKYNVSLDIEGVVELHFHLPTFRDVYIELRENRIMVWGSEYELAAKEYVLSEVFERDFITCLRCGLKGCNLLSDLERYLKVGRGVSVIRRDLEVLWRERERILALIREVVM